MKVNIISESAFTVQGHGVHTAFTETVAALERHGGWEVMQNSSQAADIMHIHTVGPYSLAKLLWGKGAKVVSAHVTPDSFVGSLIGARYWYGLAKWYLRWFYNGADAVLGVSGEVVDELKRMGVRKPVILMPNIINTDVFKTTKADKVAIRQRLDIPDDTFVVVGSGQVQPRKRIDCFVEVARQLPEVEFIWAGGIPFKRLAAESGDMERIMKEHPANVTFTGLLQREQVIDYYRAADLFFLPSNQETFGIVVVEAAAAGLPVLLRDIEQYRDTFGEGYERGTDQTFAERIAQFASDKDYYERWKRAAEEIAQRYDSKAGARRLVDIYAEVLAAKR